MAIFGFWHFDRVMWRLQKSFKDLIPRGLASVLTTDSCSNRFCGISEGANHPLACFWRIFVRFSLPRVPVQNRNSVFENHDFWLKCLEVRVRFVIAHAGTYGVCNKYGMELVSMLTYKKRTQRKKKSRFQKCSGDIPIENGYFWILAF